MAGALDAWLTKEQEGWGAALKDQIKPTIAGMAISTGIGAGMNAAGSVVNKLKPRPKPRPQFQQPPGVLGSAMPPMQGMMPSPQDMQYMNNLSVR